MEQSPALKAIGLVSDSSGDGIDAVLVEISGTGPDANVRMLAYRRYPYQAKMRQAVQDLLDPTEGCGADHISHMNFALGEMLAAAAVDLVKDVGADMAQVDLVGSLGHAVVHSPEQVEVGGMWTISALQIGEPSVIAERSGITVIADFRASDMAAGGRGAPLLAYTDYALLRSANRNRAVQTIGAIGSVTYVPAHSGISQVAAFDTGPGTVLMDSVVARLTEGRLIRDTGGALALTGKPDRVLLGRLMNHPFLQKRPPKCTGRREFGPALADALVSEYADMATEDLVATVTAFVAHSIRLSCERWMPGMPDDLIVGGAGSKNPALIRMLAEALPRTKLYTHEDFGINGDAKEAMAAALYASETIRMRPSNVPAATGAKHPVVMGKIIPGRNYLALLGKTRPGEEQPTR